MKKSRPIPQHTEPKIDRPYEDAISAELWPNPDGPYRGSFGRDGWPLGFCTDKETADLTGIPLPSLLALQTAEVIFASKAPVGHGTYKRIWPLQEAAVGNVVFHLKQVASVDFKTISKLAVQAGTIARIAFSYYVQMRAVGKGAQFGANLVLSDHQNFALQVSDGLKLFDKSLVEISIGSLNVIPFAQVQNGIAAPVNRDDPEEMDRFVTSFKNSRIQGTVILGNVFEQFEQQARAMRKT